MECKATLLFLLTLTGCIQLYGSSRFPILQGSEWTIYYEIMETDSNHQDGDEYFKITAGSDTVINAKQYHKLYKSGHAYYNPVFYFNMVYMGAIRDENNKFYFVEKGKTTEEFIYDFDIDVGDTIKSSIEKGMKVTSIETLQDGRKKIRFQKTNFSHGECTNFNNSFLIEGIGSMGGLFYDSPCNHVGFREYCLACYSENENMVYMNDLSSRNCQPISSFSNTDQKPETLEVFYSPATCQLNLYLEKWNNYDNHISIYDMTGKVVYEGSFSNTENHLKLQLTKLSRGIYIALVYSSDKRISKRFMAE